MSAPTQVSSTATLNALDASLVPSSLSSKLGNLKSLKSALNNNPTLRGQILQLFTYFKRCQAQRANGRTFGRFTVPWDKTIKLNPRSYGRPEGNSNGGRSWSREVVPPQPVKSRFTAPSQPRQVYRGSGSPSVPKTNTGNNSSRQGSSRVNIK